MNNDKLLEEYGEIENWFGIKPSEEINPELEQEKVDGQIDQLIEDGYHHHGDRR